MRFALRCLLILLSALAASLSVAGELSRAQIEARVLPPLHLAEPADDLPIWPVMTTLEPEAGPIGYVFETIDFAPLPGFEGRPMNMLVWLDRNARFVSVEVLSQHEPVFVSGLGLGPFQDFVTQYANTSLLDRFTVTSPYGRGQINARPGQVVLDGVTKATASVRIANQTILSAALAVARARLGFAATAHDGPVARVSPDQFEPLSLQALLDGGYLVRRIVRNREIEALFADSPAAGLDPAARTDPEGIFAELYLGYVNAPTIGRALFGDAGFDRVMRRARDGQQLFWVAAKGRYQLFEEDFVPGTIPANLEMRQASLALELRDSDADLGALKLQIPPLDAQRVMSVSAGANLDPGGPISLSVLVTRTKGQMFPERFERALIIDYQLPKHLFNYPPPPPPEWLSSWHDRTTDLAVISGALLLLSIVLWRPRLISVVPRRLHWFRWAFLTFTLLYLGWHAQGQLSIVHLTGALKTLMAGQGLGAYLYDPVVLLIIAFSLLSLLVWGRGTFCGWLCPFGALQDFVALVARKLGIRAMRLPPRLAETLAGGRFVILALMLLSAAFLPQLAESLVEVEPFKTAITVAFVREWPFVIYCLLVLAAGAFVYKFFCRYLCPLGAALAVGGKLRLFDWLSRRDPCGKPCQTCRRRCEYDAIDRSGSIRYDDCFQCLDCVGVYHDSARCAPLLLHHRKGISVESLKSYRLVRQSDSID